MKIIILAALGILASISPVLGQLNAETRTRTSGRTMRVAAFGHPLESVYYDDGGKKMELFAGNNTLSSEMPMPKDKVLRLFHEVPATENTAAAYTPVGTIEIPEGSKTIILMIVPEDLTKDKIRGRAYKDSNSIHPARTARVFNLTPVEVAIRAGDDALTLVVGGTDTMPWKAKAFNSVAYKVAARAASKDPWELVESAECVAMDDMRTFIFATEATIGEKRTITAYTIIDPVSDTLTE